MHYCHDDTTLTVESKGLVNKTHGIEARRMLHVLRVVLSLGV